MRANLVAYREYQVFLNYPFDNEFEGLANAMHFAVIASGLVPLCARDLSVPDRPRLEMLVDAISNCKYSAHDFSRCTGEGPENFARFNMPVEMGMSLFHALHSQRQVAQTENPGPRCAFFVATPHDYKKFASDLSGLDPLVYDSETSLLSQMFEWLRGIGAGFNQERKTMHVLDKYGVFQKRSAGLRGSGKNGRLTHHESQELMFEICSACKWWTWRANDPGKLAFPPIPLARTTPDRRGPRRRGK